MTQWKVEWLVKDGSPRSIPALEFLQSIPASARAQLLAILEAVQTTGPDRWKSSQSHCAMHGELAHLHEVRDKHEQTLYRLFVCWLREEHIVVVVDGRQKPNNTTLSKAEYAQIGELAERITDDPPPFATFDDAVQILFGTGDD